MEGARRLQGQSIGLFNEGIGLLLFRWSALRTAVENEWGGRESRVKADQLVTDVLSWFTQSKGISIRATKHNSILWIRNSVLIFVFLLFWFMCSRPTLY